MERLNGPTLLMESTGAELHDTDKPPAINSASGEVSTGEVIQPDMKLEAILIQPAKELGSPSISSPDELMAAKVLGQLKGGNRVASDEDGTTIFDRMTSHPIISGSINYMLEKTLSTSSTYLPTGENPEQRETNSTTTLTESSAKRSSSSLDMDGQENGGDNETDSSIVKRPRLTSPAITGLPQPMSQNLSTARFPRSTTLRQRVTVNSAMSAQQSLQDLTELSVLNLNLESRRRLEMLIHFLKLGNNQLSDRIQNLITQIDEQRNTESDETTTTPAADETNEPVEEREIVENDSIQELKDEIVSTVKKIVTVVSKVSANSLAEPARSNVREALLRLPTNWATLFEQQQLPEGEEQEANEDLEEGLDDADDNDDDDADYSESDTDSLNSQDTLYEDSLEYHPDDEKQAQVQLQPVRRVHRTFVQRLLSNLFRYKESLTRQSRAKARQWLRERMTNKSINEPNRKVLILAQESLDMINKIIKFCNESLDKADEWNANKQEQQQQTLLNKLQTRGYVQQGETVPE